MSRPSARAAAFGSLLVLFALSAACKKSQATPAKPTPDAVAAPVVAAEPVKEPASQASKDDPSSHPPLQVCDPRGKDPLAAAREYYDDGKYEEALSCAAESCARNSDDPSAHSERAGALAALERFDEAKLAYARALALDPDLPDALLGAAHLYTVALPGSRDHDELGLLYAKRGLSIARREKDEDLLQKFGNLTAMGLNDLGQSQNALDQANEVLHKHPADHQAGYERALALFELCRFKDAKAAFTALLNDEERGAYAHHHLGLLLEREGKWKEAELHFKKARELEPEDFPAPIILSAADFSKEVEKAISELPEDMRHDLEGVPVKAEDLPAEDDLIGNDPPLSPTILGLFRGPSINEACDEPEKPGEACRSVALYRLNLGRAVTSKKELLEQIRVTLLHEVGHLRGEDDLELAARGLE
ncbi:MAG: metallopeptidase family protein [Myxococcaceae bacterium]